MNEVSAGSAASSLLRLSLRSGEECIEVGPETGDIDDTGSLRSAKLLCLRGEGSNGDTGSSGAELLASKYFVVSAC